MSSNGSAGTCQNKAINFYGKNNCVSAFAGFGRLYGGIRSQSHDDNTVKQDNWIIRTTESDDPDLPTVFMATHSVNQKLSDKGPQKPARLLIRCLNDTTAVLFEFPGYEMSDNRKFSEILYHTGGESDDILELSLAADESVLGVWQGFRSIPFVKNLFKKEKLEILATAKNGTDLKASFNISGIENRITKLRNACHW